ncbi:MAG: AMIN domain-containing protein [Arhodomonas sp.]|nr:AMIN domain-containing protein [Arhodomonas sp.]
MRLLIPLALLALSLTANAAQLDVADVRTWSGPEHTRVVLDLSGAPDYELFTLDNPDRVVVDLKNARIGDGVVSGDELTGILRDIRTGVRNGRDLRVVLDLEHGTRAESFGGGAQRYLRPSAGGGPGAARPAGGQPPRRAPGAPGGGAAGRAGDCH